MDFKFLKKAISVKSKRTGRRLKKTAKSYVSLFVVVGLIVASTTAWLTAKDSIAVTSPVLRMDSSTGMQDDQLQAKQTEIAISNFRMEEASSVDGRNIYFPSSFKDNASDEKTATVVYRSDVPDAYKVSGNQIVDYKTTSTNIKDQTEKLAFREGNAGDKMIRYAYASTRVDSSGADTKVWLKGYEVKIGSNVYKDQIDLTYDGSKPTGQYFPETCPVRIAIIDDSGKAPKVFDPSARLKDYVVNTDAVYNISTEGEPTTKTTTLDSFSSYYYGTDNPLFTIDAGKSIELTVVAWLEGTHPYASKFVGEEMSLTIEVETNVNEMEEIYLHDWTIADHYGVYTSDDPNKESDYRNNMWSDNSASKPDYSGPNQWLSGDVNIAMSYYDNIAKTYKTNVMTKQSTKDPNGCTVYKTAIPKYVSTNISFYRLSLGQSNAKKDDVFDGTVFNSWHTYPGVNNNVKSDIKNNSNWLVLGSLAENRNIGSSTSTYKHYFAMRGNGYGNVNHNDSNRYEYWLSPCVGYWGNASGPVKRN